MRLRQRFRRRRALGRERAGAGQGADFVACRVVGAGSRVASASVPAAGSGSRSAVCRPRRAPACVRAFLGAAVPPSVAVLAGATSPVVPLSELVAASPLSASPSPGACAPPKVFARRDPGFVGRRGRSAVGVSGAVALSATTAVVAAPCAWRPPPPGACRRHFLDLARARFRGFRPAGRGSPPRPRRARRCVVRERAARRRAEDAVDLQAAARLEAAHRRFGLRTVDAVHLQSEGPLEQAHLAAFAARAQRDVVLRARRRLRRRARRERDARRARGLQQRRRRRRRDRDQRAE